MAERWWIKPFLRLCDARPLDPTRPMATRALVDEVKNGRRLVIFPEGRGAVTGSLMKSFDGAAMIAEKGEAEVTPVRVDGPDRTPFSRLPASQIRRRWFPKTTVTFLPPRRLVVDPDSARPRAPPRGGRGALRHHVRPGVRHDELLGARSSRPSRTARGSARAAA